MHAPLFYTLKVGAENWGMHAPLFYTLFCVLTIISTFWFLHSSISEIDAAQDSSTEKAKTHLNTDENIDWLVSYKTDIIAVV